MGVLRRTGVDIEEAKMKEVLELFGAAMERVRVSHADIPPTHPSSLRQFGGAHTTHTMESQLRMRFANCRPTAFLALKTDCGAFDGCACASVPRVCHTSGQAPLVEAAPGPGHQFCEGHAEARCGMPQAAGVVKHAVFVGIPQI